MHRILVDQGGPKEATGERDAGLVGQSTGEGRKEGRKARRYRRGGGNPAGFNHRPTRRPDRRGPPSASYPSRAPLLPHAEEVSKLLSSAGLPRVGREGRGEISGVGEGCKRQAGCYADRAYLELTDASQSIYLAKAPLDRCPRPNSPAISTPASGGGGNGGWDRM